ncbi:4455_t:CDS:2 [Rhizophagus irregularis]|nr:4455_t:CDS:2 [Rhizophagus irregularis]
MGNNEQEGLTSTAGLTEIKKGDSQEPEYTKRDKDKQKRTRTLSDMQNVQNQLVTIVQDVHKKATEMYTDWKATGFGGQSENNTKWIEDTINQAISTISEKVKYPSEECLMEASRSNIVQRIKDAIHDKFSDLTKPKTQNRQVTSDEEKKFKNSDITRECYIKLNKPVDVNDNPHYTFLNLIINRVFTNPKTEKNSIAFGMAVVLNYLDPSKGVNIVPIEVIERMNFFLERMQVSERESL